jgi:hypothetical protein
MGFKDGDLIDTSDLYRDLTAKALGARIQHNADRRSLALETEFWEGYATALEWVRDELLELVDPGLPSPEDISRLSDPETRAAWQLLVDNAEPI